MIYTLSSLPDISNLDTKNVTNMSYMFNYCCSLSSLPDISNWDTKNVTYMGSMFYGCSSLSSLFEIFLTVNYYIYFIFIKLAGCFRINQINSILLINTHIFPFIQKHSFAKSSHIILYYIYFYNGIYQRGNFIYETNSIIHPFLEAHEKAQDK